MSKMGLHDPFRHLKHKLWPKESSGVKLVVWLSTIKVENRPDFLACRWCATYCWKAFDKGYSFAWNLISIGSLHTKLWGPKVAKVPALGISGQNAIWMWALWKCRKYIIRGKVVASPKFGPWWVLWVRICPWFILTPKMLQLRTNQLVVWFCVGSGEWLSAFHSS
jgi:hypothetical protein